MYTVVKSKAARMVEGYKENYFVVGPYFVNKAIGEFQEKLCPDFLKAAFEAVKAEGIICHYGTWYVEGMPSAILIDFSGFTRRTDEIKGELWNLFRIDSLGTEYFDFDEPVVWAYSAGRLIEQLAEGLQKGRAVIAHFHEWLSGAGLLYLKSRKANAATVFTTHATVLGRTMASADINIYDALGRLRPDEEAYKFRVHPKHQVEKGAAQNADVFTTVSEITGLEATSILGRKPEIILPNGLNLDKFPTFEDASIKHDHLKRRIKEFITYYFFPYYTFDLDETLIYFLSGRYEFHDKGVDIFIKGLAKLNNKLKQEKSSRTVVAFFWIPGNIKSIRTELLESKTFYQDVKESVDDADANIRERLIQLFISQKKIDSDALLGKELEFELKRKVMRLFRKGTPPLSTHDLYNDDSDLILSLFRKLGLNNAENDRVKVVFYPIYLTGADRLLDLNYSEAMEGSHLGVFPSFYEPWGYTPLEAAALGVSSVTTDLAGFGRYIARDSQRKNAPGVFVVKRMGRSDDDVVDDLAEIMYRYSKLTKEERIKNKIEAKHAAGHADWKNLINNYFAAHQLALKKRFGEK
ncbi:glycogen/starch synthase [Candidatus Woesearchaeota archaeon]|nr:glycogen/starch synthase [Candidatus Woesearchaeota archaeon]